MPGQTVPSARRSPCPPLSRRTLLGGLALGLALPALLAPRPLAAQAQEIDVSSVREMAIGDPDAPVTVIEYASFTCPHCATFHADVFPQLKAEYVDTGKVRFVYREVYFDRFGLWAAMVARCDGGQRYFGIVDQIYARQREWTAGGDPATIAANLRRIGLASGLSEEALDGCLSDAQQAETLVAWYRDNAAADGIDSTPSFVIDGDKFSNMSYGDFAAELDSRLEADG